MRTEGKGRSEASDMAALYDQDFVRWIDAQARALRELRWEDLDLWNLVEEVEALGRSERHALRNRLKLITQHLLKAQYTRSMQASWEATVQEQRSALEALLDDNPSLRAEVGDAIRRRYHLARKDAAREMGVSIEALPETCPFTPEEVLG
jgi:adenosyl cobinamide kinase/adenosyl cobinamide phosphate guanylyltransferase